jgi:HAD superfamily hydrolase (TIGR01450 family)
VALADRFDGFLIDLDGVVWLGDEPIAGSPEAAGALRAAGKEIAFVTNNPARTPEAYAERLADIGIEAEPERIVTAGVVSARLAARAAGRGAGAFVIGSGTLKRTVVAAGLTVLEGEAGAEAEVVLVSAFRGFDYEQLRTATRALGRGAAFVGTSHDPTLPMPDGAWPGSGAILAAVETASGREAEIGGKPEQHLFEMALEAIGRPARVAMVGDRISSDIDGGRGAGLETVLVLSGASDRAQAEAASPPPDHVLENLAGLLQ